jgi:hypothetical protein
VTFFPALYTAAATTLPMMLITSYKRRQMLGSLA